MRGELDELTRLVGTMPREMAREVLNFARYLQRKHGQGDATADWEEDLDSRYGVGGFDGGEAREVFGINFRVGAEDRCAGEAKDRKGRTHGVVYEVCWRKATQRMRNKNSDGTKRNKAEQLKWPRVLRGRFEIVEMARGF